MKKPTKHDCAGCRDDFYNGRNDIGVRECWCLADATFVRAKDVPINMRPPYTHLPLTKRPSCYRAQGYVRMETAK